MEERARMIQQEAITFVRQGGIEQSCPVLVQTFKDVQDLTDIVRPFYQLAAELAGIKLSMLVRAVATLESNWAKMRRLPSQGVV
jgi:hypothetical protein